MSLQSVPAPPQFDLPFIAPGTFEITWGASASASRYELEGRFYQEPWQPLYSGPQQRFTVGNPTPLPDGYHTFSVKACNYRGCSDPATASVAVVNVPTTPAGLTAPSATDGKTSFVVSWNPSNGIVHYYELAKRELPDGVWTTRNIEYDTQQVRYGANHQSGEYIFKVRACHDEVGCSPYSGTVSVSIAEPRTEPVDPPAPHIEPIPLIDQDSEAVGKLEGELQVTAAGAMAYTIPITLPQGVAGVKPSVSLAYNSQAGNGVMGVGWSLQATSMITRCRQTSAQDGRNLPLTMTESDRFCLDGQRLRLYAGAYGADGAEYRTEIDSYTKIVSYGDTGNGPQYFQAWRQDGTVQWYGETRDSRLNANSSGSLLPAITNWALNRSADTRGNTIDYQYTNYSGRGELLLSGISYGGNPSLGQQRLVEVAFIYQHSRSDTSVRYSAGSKYAMSHLLERIDIIDHQFNQLLRAYHLTYANDNSLSSSRHRLTQVEVCVDEYRTNCLAPTVFQWALSDAPEYGSGQQVGFHWDEVQACDFNLDGRDDLVTIKWPGRFAVYLSTGNGFQELQLGAGTTSLSHFDSDDIRLANDSLRIADFDGDGRCDIAFMYNDTSSGPLYFHHKWRYFYSSWDAESQSLEIAGNLSFTIDSSGDPNRAYDILENTTLVDVTGDGRSDILYGHDDSTGVFRIGQLVHPVVRYEYVPVSNARSSVQADHITGVSDYNGDGIADWLGLVTRRYDNTRERKYWAVFDSSGGNNDVVLRERKGRLSAIRPVPEEVIPATVEREDIFPVDLNSDGLSDLVYRHEGQWLLRINTGKLFLEPVPIDGIGSDYAKVQFIDYNGDGFTDIAFGGEGINNTRIHVKLWDGRGYFSDEVYDTGLSALHLSSHDTQRRGFFINAKGNGRPGAIAIGPQPRTGNRLLVYRPELSPVPLVHELITRVDTGLDNYYAVDYQPLSNGAVYSPVVSSQADSHLCDRQERFRVRDQVTGALTVVAAVSSPGASDSSEPARVSYHYRNLKVNTRGRGVLGYRERLSLDHQSNILSYTQYGQHFPYTGLAERTELYRLSTAPAVMPVEVPVTARLLNRGETQWQYPYVNACQTPPIVQMRISRSRESLFEPYTEQLLSTTSNVYSYNRYGERPSLHRQIIEDHVNTTTAEKRAEHTYYADDLERWRLGQLQRSEVSHSRTGQPAQTRVSEFFYDSDSGSLTKEVIEPEGKVEEQLSKAYQYDVYGNVIATTVCSTEVTDCGQDLTQDYNNPLFINRSDQVTYDNYGRYRAATIDAKGHITSEIVMRGPFGILSERSANGVVTDNAYDRFGRLYFTATTLGTHQHLLQRYCEAWRQECPAAASNYIETRGGGTATTRTFYDALRRTVRESTQSFDGRWSHVDYTYDNRSQPTVITEPYFDGDLVFESISRYDFMGRNTELTMPDGTRTTMAYDGFTVTTTNAKNQTTVKRSNALGELISVADALGSPAQTDILYEYDVFGNLTATMVGAQRTVTSIAYDRLSRKIRTADADKGTWQYRYNALGELIEQTDAKGQVQRNYYDELGRLVRQVGLRANGGTDYDRRWTFDTAANGIDKIHREEELIGAFSREWSYDGQSRISTRKTRIANRSVYTQRTTYDEFSRVFQQYDIAGPVSVLRNRYNTYGYLSAITHELTGDAYYQTLAVDARGQVTSSLHGNGVRTERRYDPAMGRLTDIISTGALGVSRLQDLHFDYDVLGNVTLRRDSSGSRPLEENFSYDVLNRLTTLRSERGVESYVYDDLGNLLNKSDVGSYRYGDDCAVAAGPHAVCEVDNGTQVRKLSYDANGNLTGEHIGPRTQRLFDYNTFDKLHTVSKPGARTDFRYDTKGERYSRRDERNSVGAVLTYYIGNVETTTQTYSPVIVHRRYIGDTAIEVIEQNKDTGEIISTKTEYLLKDHLGSLDKIIDNNGRVVHSLSFDAFGQRRDAADWTAFTPLELNAFSAFMRDFTPRGFSGHEHVDGYNVVHMNGRIYDPQLGRFLQADPYIGATDDPQNFNRYSYVLNNPLSYTDPSGYFAKKFGAWLRKNPTAASLIQMTLTIATGLIFPDGGATAAAIMGAISGAIEGAAAYGNWSGVFMSAVVGGASGLATNRIGGLKNMSGDSRALVHGAKGGVMALFKGQSIGEAGRTAGMSFFSSLGGLEMRSSMHWSERAAHIAVAAVQGGMTAAAFRGNFAEGMKMAAFVHTFNHLAHLQQTQPSPYSDIVSGNMRFAYDSKVVIFRKQNGEFLPITEDEYLTVVASLELVFNKGGIRGAEYKRYILGAEQMGLAINLNDGCDSGCYAKTVTRYMDLDINPGHAPVFVDYGTNPASVKTMSPVRIIAHEIGHLRWPNLSEQRITEITDTVMAGITGTVRRDYGNGHLRNP
ncbi:SpvB/TcaC N-terminal domain-containing protein [Exilibacterium tricleocarpae]|uniref:SpvB/TcaC N-terminal domain-containing protein n=1 Tax=Exilibacterium tricleocarpae TaxID=2591008 RepID=UPI0015D10B4C|nr:SpvB/TcaC N-terminal domain-containing protein [Exilibacterium tricleocarpae]